jgi:predicted ATPase
MFKHALTHDVAYNSLLVQRRRELHRIIALAIEELYADRLAEQYDVLAYHFAKAEAWDQAVPYLRKAGAKAIARSANRESASHLEEALVALSQLPETHEWLQQSIDVRFELRQALVLLGEYTRALDLMREAEALADRLRDLRRLGQACAYLAQILSTIIDCEPSVEAGRRALAIATELDDVVLSAVARLSLGRTLHELGDYRSAMDLLRTNVEVLTGALARETL